MLRIKTFTDNGVSCFFKAIGHIAIQPKLQTLLSTIRNNPNIAIYDPEGRVAEFCDLTGAEIKHFYVQKIEALHQEGAKLISEIKDCDMLLILAFDAKRYHDHIRHLLPSNCQVITLDEIRISDDMLTVKNDYLHRYNWATNFVWFKEQDGIHTRLVSANYWVKYGAKEVMVYMYLLDQNGKEIKRWTHTMANRQELFILDSKEVKTQHNLPDFMGQVYIHLVGIAGHDVVKYALDVYGDDPHQLSATHDANGWTCNYFAGLPAPKENEKVVLWLQNTHPVAIKPDTVSLNVMGEEKICTVPTAIPAYGMLDLDVASLFPGLKYPAQLELNAGNYFVRPRYEVFNLANKRNWIAHMNVERENLPLDSNFKNVAKHLGKAYILPAPIPALDRFTMEILPTPMNRNYKNQALKAIVYDNQGNELTSYNFGALPRNHQHSLNVSELIKDLDFFKQQGNYGNIQLVYDLQQSEEVDGWIHAIFKFHDKHTGHSAETSFGSHIFNNITTYKSEPQSYKGPPPGLSTGLFLRVGPAHLNSLCYLIYPVSQSWHKQSHTVIALYEADKLIKQHEVAIAANGDYLLDCHKIFGQELIGSLRNPYVYITDRTCRLFGYHILDNGQAFSLDHMFGF